MKEAVIFDMDGVIIDSEPFYYEIEKDINKELGIDVSIEEHKSFVGVTSYHMWSVLK
ncbi:MAG TPA: phosphatase, partial [Clostridiaceae bacterium]|nr:phosphatase [Clostridiaceae bacterium]